MTNTKFRLLEDDAIEAWGRTLHRIEALEDFAEISKGEKGGYIEKEDNLAVSGDAWVSGNAYVYGNARVSGDAWVSGNAYVYGNACISGDACVSGDAWVSGNARVSGNACISGDACVSGYADLIVIYPIGSENGILTAFKNKEGKISVTRGCFAGTLEEFIAAVEETHEDNEYAKTYRIAVELIKSKMEEQKHD